MRSQGEHAGPFDSKELPRFRSALLAWYDENQRDLPWRKTRDPYRVWISEIMLQQTRVAAVLPRYEKFLGKFPSVQKLAAARESSILTEWSGLGYYRRARNLHAAAKVIAGKLRGSFPETADRWRDLPGIGRYTAAAIASIAFGEAVAVLDGNVERVLRRVLHARDEKASWRAAEAVLDRSRPGDFNQAMMELGALVCVPGQPLCSECPIRRFCRTRGIGEKVARTQRRNKKQITYALIRSSNSVFLVQRQLNDHLMPGMWQLPETSAAAAREKMLFIVRHSITVTDYVVRVVSRTDSASETGRWVRISRLEKLALTGLTKKILRRAQII